LIVEHAYRPETVESLFLAWRQTGHPMYRDQGWKIFQAIEKYCKIPQGGYVSVLNVNSTVTPTEDKMETFFLVRFSQFSYSHGY
jgi:endoplasmic reticulum Man9GlcNAc2 1,2-alpha-mannosidase